jgi:hypothetical protein
MSDAERFQINFSVSKPVFDRLAKEAANHNIARGGYAKVLFNAAYSARFGETGDQTLDATVAAALLLHGAGLDASRIALALKCSEETVSRIVVAFASRTLP